MRISGFGNKFCKAHFECTVYYLVYEYYSQETAVVSCVGRISHTYQLVICRGLWATGT